MEFHPPVPGKSPKSQWYQTILGDLFDGIQISNGSSNGSSNECSAGSPLLISPLDHCQPHIHVLGLLEFMGLKDEFSAIAYAGALAMPPKVTYDSWYDNRFIVPDRFPGYSIDQRIAVLKNTDPALLARIPLHHYYHHKARLFIAGASQSLESNGLMCLQMGSSEGKILSNGLKEKLDGFQKARDSYTGKAEMRFWSEHQRDLASDTVRQDSERKDPDRIDSEKQHSAHIKKVIARYITILEAKILDEIAAYIRGGIRGEIPGGIRGGTRGGIT